jgi:hypothetical protein
MQQDARLCSDSAVLASRVHEQGIHILIHENTVCGRVCCDVWTRTQFAATFLLVRTLLSTTPCPGQPANVTRNTAAQLVTFS